MCWVPGEEPGSRHKEIDVWCGTLLLGYPSPVTNPRMKQPGGSEAKSMKAQAGPLLSRATSCKIELSFTHKSFCLKWSQQVLLSLVIVAGMSHWLLSVAQQMRRFLPSGSSTGCSNIPFFTLQDVDISHSSLVPFVASFIHFMTCSPSPQGTE